MRFCLSCETTFTAGDWTCPVCGSTPERIDGLPCFAPGLAHDNSDYDRTHYRMLVEVEDESFWFRARNRLILWTLARYFPHAERLIEIGVGTGFVMRAMRKALPKVSMTGCDIHVEGLGFAAGRVGSSVELMQLDARRLPFRSEFDVVCMFDTLEHIAEDEEVLAQVYRALRPGGGIVLTVPQHQSLWGPADEVAFHQRRYGTGELRKKAEAAGFRTVLQTSFVSLLFPALWVARMRSRRTGVYAAENEHRLHPALNWALAGVMSIEFAAISAGLRLPFGGSQLLAAVRD
jgi:ubiquinone/menaquinone biosynthesis C-methylase UbiE